MFDWFWTILAAGVGAPAVGALVVVTAAGRRRAREAARTDRVTTRRALRALTRGRTPSDPRVREAAILLLPQVRRNLRAVERFLLRAGVTVAVAFLVVGLLTRRWLVLFFGLPLLYYWAFATVLVVHGYRRLQDRAERGLREGGGTDR